MIPSDHLTRRIRLLAAALLVAGIMFAASGCSAEPLVADEGELTCIECHTDRDLLKADLEADPKPVREKAESEGEG